jgi:hypothetical protein
MFPNQSKVFNLLQPPVEQPPLLQPLVLHEPEEQVAHAIY